ncbi:hypothetical protein Q8A73_013629 [Channa argus]|nr:hypothetical protein Q8A73_013629 [Channa argus]
MSARPSIRYGVIVVGIQAWMRAGPIQIETHSLPSAAHLLSVSLCTFESIVQRGTCQDLSVSRRAQSNTSENGWAGWVGWVGWDRGADFMNNRSRLMPEGTAKEEHLYRIKAVDRMKETPLAGDWTPVLPCYYDMETLGPGLPRVTQSHVTLMALREHTPERVKAWSKTPQTPESPLKKPKQGPEGQVLCCHVLILVMSWQGPRLLPRDSLCIFNKIIPPASLSLTRQDGCIHVENEWALGKDGWRSGALHTIPQQ